ncbi:carbohydrate ABC transporter substrate-binding protein [Metabacillus sp. KIGAM252]|uniref:Carbohydrate ABC transporter substrate-binding protein n=1 Tax=Metabacillus flavus TaxID=2823519 RepID=A0ABS5L912_9BACI|nr:ABC transporter substrate-binding protein [Metabacillus flavus]MBS2967217.1 carbohydrate ABC transporter substrate-binding protein [Metabacillus flavus]
MFRKRFAFSVFLLFGMVLLSSCQSENTSSDGRVKLELFSNKSENVKTFEGLIAEFEEKNPKIDIQLNAPPEADTVLKTRLVKEDMPDMLAIGGNGSYGELANAGIFYDFSKTDLLDQVKPSYVEMINTLSNEQSGTYGIPYATNANVVIYNKAKFKKYGFDAPRTWSEFTEQLEKVKEAGDVPIYFTLKDAWTGMIPWNSVAGNLQGDNFAEKKRNGEASFEKNYSEVADKMLTLLEYGHKNNYGYGYADGNKAFANGNGVFYLQGNWAIPEIQKINPELELGVFPLPVTDQPDQNNLVSGVDVLLTMNKDIEHPEEAKKFLNFMLEEEQSKRYIEEQKAFSALEGVIQEDPVMEGIQESLKNEQLTGFPDHAYPRAIRAEGIIQEFLISKNKEAFLRKMDREWDKVQNRY